MSHPLAMATFTFTSNILELLSSTEEPKDQDTVVEEYTQKFRNTTFVGPAGFRRAFYLTSCFINLDEVKDEAVPLLSPIVQQSKDMLLDKLLSAEPIQSFHPRAIILAEEERRIQEKLNELKRNSNCIGCTIS